MRWCCCDGVSMGAHHTLVLVFDVDVWCSCMLFFLIFRRMGKLKLKLPHFHVSDTCHVSI